MPEFISIEFILKTWLKANGYDGLCNPGLECGCYIGDLAPCGEPDAYDCVAGHKEKAPKDCGFDYFIYPGKESVKEE